MIWDDVEDKAAYALTEGTRVWEVENLDAEMAGIASTAATTIVKLLATDGWEEVKSAVGALWRRVHPENASLVETELEETRNELTGARQKGDEQTELALTGEWRVRLRDLMATEPSLVEQVQTLVRDLRSVLPDAEATHVSVAQKAEGTDHAEIYQAGRDIHISRS